MKFNGENNTGKIHSSYGGGFRRLPNRHARQSALGRTQVATGISGNGTDAAGTLHQSQARLPWHGVHAGLAQRPSAPILGFV